MRSEEEFIQAIDCRFPYGDENRAAALIEEACGICPNAVFMIVHEVARVPRGVPVDDATRYALLDRIDKRFEHPLKGPVLEAARRMVGHGYLSTDECLELMRVIRPYRHQSSALTVAECSCEESGIYRAADLADEIGEEWRVADLRSRRP